MGKKFIFNPDTLSFELKKFSVLDTLKTILPHLLITITLGAILGYTLFNTAQTPELKDLEGRNAQLMNNFQVLSHQIDNQNNRLLTLENQDDNTFRSVLGLHPIPTATRTLGTGGNSRTRDLSLFGTSSNLVDELSSKSLSINNRIKLEAESYNLILQMVKDRDQMLKSIPSVSPMAKKDIRRIGSGFGYRMHPILHVMKMHTGVDISGQKGKPIYATGDGVIIRADASSGGYGNCIRINHGYSYQTVYAHLDKILVVPGQVVKRGQLIGLLGNTGRSTSPHLHYEVRINNKPVNPLNYFYNDMTDDEYEIMVNSASAAQTAEPM